MNLKKKILKIRSEHKKVQSFTFADISLHFKIKACTPKHNERPLWGIYGFTIINKWYSQCSGEPGGLSSEMVLPNRRGGGDDSLDYSSEWAALIGSGET